MGLALGLGLGLGLALGLALGFGVGDRKADWLAALEARVLTFLIQTLMSRFESLTDTPTLVDFVITADFVIVRKISF